jgi:cytochrome c oxidase subunit 3
MGAVSWWLVKQTVHVTPWVADADPDAVRDQGVKSPLTSVQLPTVKMGLGVFLAVATSIFALFISAYSIRMAYSDWRPLTEPGMLWANTGVLVLASVFLQRAWNAANNKDLSKTRVALSMGAFFSVVFIAGQLFVWNSLAATGNGIDANPANGFFYMLTGAHGLHLLGGLVALARSISRVRRFETHESIRLGVELCAVYWHYLLVVWLILFALLLTT